MGGTGKVKFVRMKNTLICYSYKQGDNTIYIKVKAPHYIFTIILDFIQYLL